MPGLGVRLASFIRDWVGNEHIGSLHTATSNPRWPSAYLDLSVILEWLSFVNKTQSQEVGQVRGGTPLVLGSSPVGWCNNNQSPTSISNSIGPFVGMSSIKERPDVKRADQVFLGGTAAPRRGGLAVLSAMKPESSAIFVFSPRFS